MSRIWRRIPLLNGVKNDCIVWSRLTFSRSLSASACRCDSAKEKDDETNSKPPKPSMDKPVTVASNLLSTLTGLKVEKNLGSKVGRSSPRLRSATADFRELLGQKKAKDKDGVSAGTKGPEDVQKMVVETAKVVAKIFPEKEVVESDLLKQLRKHDEATSAGQRGDLDAVSSILSGIKVERQTTLQKEKERHITYDERALAGSFGSGFDVIDERGRDDLTDRRWKHKEPIKRQHKRTLFDRQRLNVFMPTSDDSSETQVVTDTELTTPSLWDKEEVKQLKKLSYSTINNGFDEMVKWTEEGKMWHYPVNNEQGLEEEQQVPFHEHIFFDHLLEDLPAVEPIQTFMELVCLGLSQNPYLNVQQKHDHIHWFKNYFREREGVIKEAIEAEKVEEARGMAT